MTCPKCRKKKMLDIVKTPELLISIAHNAYDVDLNPIEAKIILGYLEGSDFCLLYEFSGKYVHGILRIHDNQSLDEDSGEIVYKLSQVIDFCYELCATILSEQEDLRNPDNQYVCDLMKDEAILDQLSVLCFNRYSEN